MFTVLSRIYAFSSVNFQISNCVYVVVVRAGVSVKDCRPIGIIGRQLRDNQPNHDDDDDKGPLHKKKMRDYLGIFPKCRTPAPLFGRPPSKKNG